MKSIKLFVLFVLFFLVLYFNLSCDSIKKDKWKTVTVSEVQQGTVTIAGFADKDFGITVGYGGQKRYTVDGGKTWEIGQNKSFCRFGLEILNRDRAWSCGNLGHNRITDDGGKNWKSLQDFGPAEPLQCRFISFCNDKNGWLASPSILAKTNDSGESWEQMDLPPDIGNILAINLPDLNIGYLLDDKGIIFKTTDLGKSWKKMDLALEKENYYLASTAASSCVMKFINNKGIVILRQVKPDLQIVALYTEDAGKTWEPKIIPYKIPGNKEDKSEWEYYMFLSQNWKYLTINAGPSRKCKYITLMKNQNRI